MEIKMTFHAAAIAGSFALHGWAHACSMLDDPMSPQCREAAPKVAMPGLPTAPQGLPRDSGETYPSNVAPRNAAGERECALYDLRTKHCTVYKMTPDDYDRAVNTGIGAASAGLEVQEDIYRRIYGQAGALPLPGAAQTGRQESAAASCVSKELGILESILNRPLNAGDLATVGERCGIR